MKHRRYSSFKDSLSASLNSFNILTIYCVFVGKYGNECKTELFLSMNPIINCIENSLGSEANKMLKLY